MIQREAIAAAVFARVAGLPGVMTTSRRVRAWNKVDAAEQPAVFVLPGRQVPTRVRGFPTKWTLAYEIALYAHVATCDAPDPTTRLHAMLDAVEAAFGPDNGDGVCTLGGLVETCTLGDVETDQGALGDQAVAVVALTIVAA